MPHPVMNDGAATRVDEVAKDELSLVLEQEKIRQAAALLEDAEEKKEMESYADLDPIASLAPSEEGQEALWLADTPHATSPTRATQRPSLFRKKEADKTRVLLLPSAEQTAALPSPVETSDKATESQAALKVATARKLLDQALSTNASVGSRQMLAKAAFSHASDARRMMEVKISPEFNTVMMDACNKGEAAVAEVRQMQLLEAEESLAEEHVNRARSLLEFIILNIDPSVKPASSENMKSPDDISTLGFDNTFEERTELDVLSMSSLNEILDGPIDEKKSPTAATRELAVPQPVQKAPVVSRSQSTPNSSLRGPAKGGRRSSIFGAVFQRSKSTKPGNGRRSKPTKANKTPQKVVEEVAHRPPLKDVQVTKLGKSPTRIFATTILIDETPANPNGLTEPEEEAPRIDELARIKSLEENVSKQLREAIDKDETESLTSHQGVPMIGRDEKRKKKKEASHEPQGPPVRNFDKIKPKFVSAPTGTAAILTAMSWESVVSAENETEQMEAPLSTENQAEEVVPTNEPRDVDTSTDDAPDLAAADSNSENGEVDKYTVGAEAEELEDKYEVSDVQETEDAQLQLPLENANEDVFESLWDRCVPANVSIADTCSTLGLQSCLNPEVEEVRTLQLDSDKYAQHDDDSVVEEHDEPEPKTEEPVQEPDSITMEPQPLLISSRQFRTTASDLKETPKKPSKKSIRFGGLMRSFRRGKKQEGASTPPTRKQARANRATVVKQANSSRLFRFSRGQKSTTTAKSALPETVIVPAAPVVLAPVLAPVDEKVPTPEADENTNETQSTNEEVVKQMEEFEETEDDADVEESEEDSEESEEDEEHSDDETYSYVEKEEEEEEEEEEDVMMTKITVTTKDPIVERLGAQRVEVPRRGMDPSAGNVTRGMDP